MEEKDLEKPLHAGDIGKMEAQRGIKIVEEYHSKTQRLTGQRNKSSPYA